MEIVNSIQICDILKETKNIAVYGISSDPDKTSRSIARFLVEQGFNVVGINPALSEVEGIKVYPKLTDVPIDIDLVDVFRRSEYIGDLIPDVLAKRPKVLWLQLGIRNNEAVKPAIDAGIDIIQDKCIYIEYKRCGLNYNS